MTLPARTTTRDYLFPVRVVIDTREQKPYTFADISADIRDGGGRTVIECETRTLASGDYSLEGYENEVAIERKSLADLYGTVGRGHVRFVRELQRLNEMVFAAVVVEAELSEILAGYHRSQLSPKVVYRSAISWMIKYPRVHWWAVPGREFGELTTFRLLEKYWKEKEKKK